MTTGKFLKTAGYLLGLFYGIIGSIVLILLLIIGFWEGFRRLDFTLSFILIAVYVYGTAAFAFYAGSKPSKAKGVFLLILILPAIWLGISGSQKKSSINSLAETYTTSENSEDVKSAEKQLLELGKRAGAKPAVVTLLEHLKKAESDEQKIHILRVLGKISYQYEPLLAHLRIMHFETKSDSNRVALHEAVEEALLEVNPYEDIPE